MDDSLRHWTKLAAKLLPKEKHLKGLDRKLNEEEYINELEKIWKRTRYHLIHMPGHVLDLHKEWDPLYTQFLYYFDELNLENDAIAISDHVFILDCRVRCCANPDLIRTANRNDFTKLSLRLRILACQPTADTRKPIDLQQVENLHNDIAAFLLLSPCHSEMVNMAKEKCFDATIRDNYYQLQYSSDALRREDVVIKAKAQLKLANDMEALLKQHMDTGDDDINRGLMFAEKPEVAMQSFMILAVRVFRCIQLEHMVIDLFPECTQTFDIPSHSYTQLDAFMNYQCGIELGTYFSQDFHRLSIEMMMPYGARLDTNRHIRSQGEVEPIDNVMLTQLGIHVSDVLGKQTYESYLCIGANKDHNCYQWLLLKLFAHVFTFRCRLGDKNSTFDFFKEYMVMPPDLFTAPDVRLDSLLDANRRMRVRRPVLFYLLHTWRVLFKNTWIVCKDLRHALLLWVHLIQTVYEGQLETGRRVDRFISVLFPEKNHELEALKKISYDTHKGVRRVNVANQKL